MGVRNCIFEFVFEGVVTTAMLLLLLLLLSNMLPRVFGLAGGGRPAEEHLW